MAGLVPASTWFGASSARKQYADAKNLTCGGPRQYQSRLLRQRGVDGRDKPGHDDRGASAKTQPRANVFRPATLDRGSSAVPAPGVFRRTNFYRIQYGAYREWRRTKSVRLRLQRELLRPRTTMQVCCRRADR